MTPKGQLVTVREGGGNDEAMQLMHDNRLERVLVVDNEFRLKGLITAKDILKSSEHPFAAKDNQGRLLVGAAVGVGDKTDERVDRLIAAGVDVIVVDTAHGFSQGVLDTVKKLKENIKGLM